MGRKVKFEFLAEQNGPVEQKFKTAVSDGFWKSGLAIQRAYLLLIDMDGELRVMLGIKASEDAHGECLAVARSVFNEMFAADEQLFIAFLDEDSEAKARGVAQPFYEITVSS